MSQGDSPRHDTPSTKTRGDAAEAAAARFLVEAGLRIVERNVVCGGVELDIVARDERESTPTCVFVEVRSRASERLGHPLETIDARKQKRLIRGASAWLVQHQLWEQVAVRFDVVAITREHEAHAQPLREDEVVWLQGPSRHLNQTESSRSSPRDMKKPRGHRPRGFCSWRRD